MIARIVLVVFGLAACHSEERPSPRPRAAPPTAVAADATAALAGASLALTLVAPDAALDGRELGWHAVVAEGAEGGGARRDGTLRLADGRATIVLRGLSETASLLSLSVAASGTVILGGKTELSLVPGDNAAELALSATGLTVPDDAAPAPAPAPAPVTPPGYALGALHVSAPQGWTLHQSATAPAAAFLGFAKGDDYVRIYVSEKPLADPQKTFVTNGAKLTRPAAEETLGALRWQVLATTKDTARVAAFYAEHEGHGYWGYARAKDVDAALAAVRALLAEVR